MRVVEGCCECHGGMALEGVGNGEVVEECWEPSKSLFNPYRPEPLQLCSRNTQTSATRFIHEPPATNLLCLQQFPRVREV